MEDIGHCADATSPTTEPTSKATAEVVVGAVAPESPVQTARRAIATATALPDPLREEIVAANNDPDGNDHVIYIDAMFNDPATDAELVSRGLVNEHETIVPWFPLPLHTLTPFGVLVRVVLTTSPEHVLARAEDEMKRHPALDAHRAQPGHDPDTCGWPNLYVPIL